MASVREIKAELLREQQEAMDVTETAISAIDTLLNLSMYVLTILGLGLALMALVGWIFIYRRVRRAAIDVAKKSFDSYIGSQEFSDLLGVAVKEEVELRMENVTVLTYLKEEEGGDEAGPFPDAEEAKK